MGGGIMQLVAYGAQDIYLTGNPQITFFKIVYRRHTNFSMETIKQNISGQSFIGVDNINNKATVTISRNGDLVTGIYVSAKQKDATGTVGICGDNLVEDVEIEIGGQRIDKHYKEWNQIWDELTIPASKSEGYKYMTGGFNNSFVSGGGTKQETIRYPLKFWFCRNPGLALPLIALQYHEIQMKFTWGVGLYDSTKDDNLTRSSTSLLSQHSVEVWADYVYLDTDERRRFSQVSHEYLIEQLQLQKEKDVSSESFKLNLEHPIKELIWTTPQNPTAPQVAITDQKLKLSINGHDRFFEREKEYFTLEQPYKHHTSIPGYNIKESENSVLLHNTIFSKDYTFTSVGPSATLDSITGNNVFTNKKLTTKTSGTSQLTDEANTFLFISNGDSANPDIEFKVGDTVRVNYYNITDTSQTATGHTDKEPSTNYEWWDGNDVNSGDFGSGDDARYRITLKAIDSNTPTYNSETSSWNAPNIRKEKHQTSAEGVTPITYELRDVPESYVQQLGVTTTSNYMKVENIIRNLTVLEVFKSTTLAANGGTLYEIKFNDSIIAGLTQNINHKVSFEIIARVQNPVSRCSQLKKDIYVYSFCLEPEEHQPSGSCNFSRIDSAKIMLSSSGSISNIYAVNYNVLRIMSGMGGLAYSS
tara:strand:- start:10990 stop:12921 length:1932 start_codon:yes stop_codon:yes gene_type:complete